VIKHQEATLRDNKQTNIIHHISQLLKLTLKSTSLSTILVTKDPAFPLASINRTAGKLLASMA
jgi:hypothetical protein